MVAEPVRFGSACAMTFAKEGAEAVLLVDINEQKASEIMEKLHGITQCAFLKPMLQMRKPVIGYLKRLRWITAGWILCRC
jgi:FlaA1/EpsC-like NDP-sugar epimerase